MCWKMERERLVIWGRLVREQGGQGYGQDRQVSAQGSVGRFLGCGQ